MPGDELRLVLGDELGVLEGSELGPELGLVLGDKLRLMLGDELGHAQRVLARRIRAGPRAGLPMCQEYNACL